MPLKIQTQGMFLRLSVNLKRGVSVENVIYSVPVVLLSVLLFQEVVFAKSKEYFGYLSDVMCAHKGNVGDGTYFHKSPK